MKLEDFNTEISYDEDDKPEQAEFEVIVENSRGEQTPVGSVRWDYDKKQVVLEL